MSYRRGLTLYKLSGRIFPDEALFYWLYYGLIWQISLWVKEWLRYEFYSHSAQFPSWEMGPWGNPEEWGHDDGNFYCWPLQQTAHELILQWQIGVRRTNHDLEFCYRYDYEIKGPWEPAHSCNGQFSLCLLLLVIWTKGERKEWFWWYCNGALIFFLWMRIMIVWVDCIQVTNYSDGEEVNTYALWEKWKFS